MKRKFGYEVDSVYWGNEYATEEARVIVRFGFAKLSLHHVSA